MNSARKLWKESALVRAGVVMLLFLVAFSLAGPPFSRFRRDEISISEGAKPPRTARPLRPPEMGRPSFHPP
uniref:hypothetical protein n=1 Tax=Treponema endosymbiont of Eucomonympha sp. TaxID=1580831 RepID=UPI000A701704